MTSKSVSAKGLLRLKFSKLAGETLVFSPSSALELGRQADVRDSYEESLVYLAPSTIPGAEEGLFARRTYPPRTLVSFYHGLNVPYDLEHFTNELNAFDEVDDERVSTSIKLSVVLGGQTHEECLQNQDRRQHDLLH